MEDHTPDSDRTAGRDPLDRLLDRVVFQTPADLDVEGALHQVRQRMKQSGGVSPLAARRAEPKGFRWRIVASFAAAAAIIIAFAMRPAKSFYETEIVAAHPAIFAAGPQPATVTLKDGTRVRLGASSTLTLADSFENGVREVTLRGDASFTVTHDAAHPFAVHAAGAVIRDLGTEFDVHSGDDGVTVAVQSGSVRVSGYADQYGIELHAGGRALRNAAISLVHDDLKRRYGIELVVADPSLAARHVTASFTDESREQVLNVIGLVLGAHAETRGDTVVLRTSSPAARPK